MTFKLPKPGELVTDAQREEARRIIATQKSTAPKDGDLSPLGSLNRHTGLLDASGRPITPPEEPIGFPKQNERMLLRQRVERERLG